MPMVKLASIKPHPKNPRKISGPKMESLKKSLQEFPKMMELQPFVIDEKRICLRGNMRLEALRQLNYIEIPDTWIKKASDLTPEEKDRFMALDNDHFGEWDYDVMAANWTLPTVQSWGLSMPRLSQSLSLTSSKTKTDKGTIVRVKCTNTAAAQDLYKDLLAKGFEVELK